MGVGFSQGLAQVTLALFTTLAPAGMVAFCVMACVLLFGKLSEKQWERMSHFLVVPLAVAVVGLRIWVSRAMPCMCWRALGAPRFRTRL